MPSRILVAVWMVWAAVALSLAFRIASHADVPLTYPSPVGSFEDGRVRVYELGSRCYVVVTDGPMGKLFSSVACK